MIIRSTEVKAVEVITITEHGPKVVLGLRLLLLLLLLGLNRCILSLLLHLLEPIGGLGGGRAVQGGGHLGFDEHLVFLLLSLSLVFSLGKFLSSSNAGVVSFAGLL